MIKPVIKILLWPLALLYGAVVSCRNLFFNWGLLKQCSFSLPVISVGNLSVGGTGKTPHTEFLIRLLMNDNKIAVLSRGYKRKTKGYVVADANSTAEIIGDEPYQIKKKFPSVIVAVDADRCHGIETLSATEKPDVILLDDAYQHRYVKPGLSILLTDYSNIFTNDYMLPMGRLREPRRNKKRADIIIVTKCPQDINDSDFYRTKQELTPAAHQQLYFSTFVYDDIKPVFPQDAEKPDISSEHIKQNNGDILVVTGIVSPAPLCHHLMTYANNVVSMIYPDHHAFSAKDIDEIMQKFNTLQNKTKIIVVTEKDAARLVNMELPRELKQNIFSIGIKVKILEHKENQLKQNIKQYVSKNKTNC